MGRSSFGSCGPRRSRPYRRPGGHTPGPPAAHGRSPSRAHARVNGHPRNEAPTARRWRRRPGTPRAARTRIGASTRGALPHQRLSRPITFRFLAGVRMPMRRNARQLAVHRRGKYDRSVSAVARSDLQRAETRAPKPLASLVALPRGQAPPANSVARRSLITGRLRGSQRLTRPDGSRSP